jgi:hypothetical protein
MEHEYFGTIDRDDSGALLWSDTLDVAEQRVDVELVAADGDTVATRSLDAAAAILRELEAYDGKARDALAAELSERGSAASDYVDEQVGTLGESLMDILVRTSGDIPMDVLRSLQLTRVLLQVDDDDDDSSFATLEYALDSEATDDILTVALNSAGEVVSIDTDAGSQ